jgi:hypothetical protein
MPRMPHCLQRRMASEIPSGETKAPPGEGGAAGISYRLLAWYALWPLLLARWVLLVAKVGPTARSRERAVGLVHAMNNKACLVFRLLQQPHRVGGTAGRGVIYDVLKAR